MKQPKKTKEEQKKTSAELDKFTLTLGIIGMIVLPIALGYSIRTCTARKQNPEYTTGIVTEIYWPSIKSKFRYVFFVDDVMYTNSNSFYSADIEPGDTVYVIYEKGNPENAIVKRKDLGWSNGDPIYSKCVKPKQE